jgi:hypothetical protein
MKKLHSFQNIYSLVEWKEFLFSFSKHLLTPFADRKKVYSASRSLDSPGLYNRQVLVR